MEMVKKILYCGDSFLYNFKKLIETNEDDKIIKNVIFHIRDIKKLGNRYIFISLMNNLFLLKENLFYEILKSGEIEKLGNWKDYIILYCEIDNKKVRNTILDIITDRIIEDLKNLKDREISLVGKWIPTEKSKYDKYNLVNNISRMLGRKYNLNNMTNIDNIKLNGKKESYRKICSLLREKLKVTERLMSLKRNDEIEKITFNNYLFNQKYFKNYKFEKDKKESILEEFKLNWKENVDKCVIKLRKDKQYIPQTIVLQNKKELGLIIGLFYANVEAIFNENWVKNYLIGNLYFFKNRIENNKIYNEIVKKEICFAHRKNDKVERYSLENILENLVYDFSLLKITDNDKITQNIVLIDNYQSVNFNCITWNPTICSINIISENIIYGYSKIIIKMLLEMKLLTIENFILDQIFNYKEK